jgi:hypothetical protein
MASPVTTLSIDKSLYLKGLQSPAKIEMVYATDFGYNVMTQLISQLGASESTPLARFEVASMGNLSVYQTISSNATASGSNLVIPVPSSEGFRVNDIVESNNVQGHVVAVGSGTVTVQSVNTTLAAGTHFLAGAVVRVLFDASANKNSRGRASLNYTPDTDYGYTAVTRESGAQSRRDRSASRVMWAGDYWYTSYDELTMRAFAKTLEYKYAFSERAVLNAGANNETYTTGGLRWSIINNGGQYMPLSSAMTLDNFNDMLYQMAQVSAENGRRLVCLMGLAALRRLQDLVGDKYITPVGNANTFGGTAVQGIDVYKYNYLGLSVEFVRWGLLDDESFRAELSSINGTPIRSNSIYFMDLSPVPSVSGGGSMSPLQKYHFNNDELIAGYLPGMTGLTVDADPSSVKAAIAGANASMVVSDVDSTQFEILSDCGLYCVPNKLGLIEFTS